MGRLNQLITEIHHRSLWQVLLVYVGAAWACFELIDAVTERLGLPVWLPGFAIVLFLLGLPFVVATALVREEGPPPADEPPTAEISSDKMSLSPMYKQSLPDPVVTANNVEFLTSMQFPDEPGPRATSHESKWESRTTRQSGVSVSLKVLSVTPSIM